MATAVIEGDHPVRGRLIVSDTSGNNQLAASWGLRSRYYDSSATAALFYEAEALTPLNGAAVTGLSGASGGDVVTITSLPTANWVAMLSRRSARRPGNWTHQGSYRVWARCYSSTGTPQFQLQWGVGSLACPATNTSVTLPGSGAFYLLDLGEVRIDGPPVGTAQWLGAIQAYSASGGDSASVDCIYLQPLDDGAGQLTYVDVPPSSSIATTTLSPTTGYNDATIGTITWAGISNAFTLNGYTAGALCDSGVGTTAEYLKLEGYGFAIPSTATIVGIQVSAYYAVYNLSAPYPIVVHLVKAGTVQSGSPSSAITSAYGSLSPNGTVTVFGGPTDLWGGSWAYSDINNSAFGIAFSFSNTTASSQELGVDCIQILVYYTLSSGFTVVKDAVIYANEACQVCYDGMYRQGPSSGPYGVVSQVVGDLARLPPSGMENRPCQVFIKPSRGDMDTLPDSGLDSFEVQPLYTPAWIFRP